jgi:hypothetical protein
MAPKINLLAPLNPGHKSPAHSLYVYVCARSGQIADKQTRPHIPLARVTSFAGAFPFVFVCRPNWCSITTELTLESIRVRSGKESTESGPWGCASASLALARRRRRQWRLCLGDRPRRRPTDRLRWACLCCGDGPCVRSMESNVSADRPG